MPFAHYYRRKFFIDKIKRVTALQMSYSRIYHEFLFVPKMNFESFNALRNVKETAFCALSVSRKTLRETAFMLKDFCIHCICSA